MTTVGEIGERRVLARILEQLSQADSASVGPGDDAAVLRTSGELVLTSDTMIEGPDFRLAWHTGYDLGRKLAATNLSDVAAMGARPIALTVSLACPGDTPVSLLEEIARGLDSACRQLAPGCGVVGGDLATAPSLIAAVTALGDLEGRPPVLRSGARAGHVIAYAGQLGLAGLGLSILFRDATEGNGVASSSHVAALRQRHAVELQAQFSPEPPIGAGIAAGFAQASSMMDVSDGLSLDAERLAIASDATLAFDSDRLLAGFGEQHGVSVSVEAMLTGGEDHGMLATFSPGLELPDGFVSIGEVRAARSDGARVLLDGVPFTPRGWDPFA